MRLKASNKVVVFIPLDREAKVDCLKKLFLKKVDFSKLYSADITNVTIKIKRIRVEFVDNQYCN